jgi:hypothetical protein
MREGRRSLGRPINIREDKMRTIFRTHDVSVWTGFVYIGAGNLAELL